MFMMNSFEHCCTCTSSCKSKTLVTGHCFASTILWATMLPTRFLVGLRVLLLRAVSQYRPLTSLSDKSRAARQGQPLLQTLLVSLPAQATARASVLSGDLAA